MSDEAFETFKGKLTVLFAHKAKEAIAAHEEEINSRIEEAIASKVQEATSPEPEVSEASEEEELEVEETTEASLPNNNGEAAEQISLINKLKENFSVEVTK